MEQFVDDYVNETLRNEPDNEILTDTGNSDDDINDVSEDNMFIQAHQDGVYQLNAKYSCVQRYYNGYGHSSFYKTVLVNFGSRTECFRPRNFQTLLRNVKHKQIK